MTIEQLPPAAGNPFAGLVRSRKFWMTILDVVISTVLFFAAKYAGAAIDDVKFLIVTFQPVIALVIISLAVEDTAKMQAHARIQVAQHEAESALDVAEAKAPADNNPWPPKS